MYTALSVFAAAGIAYTGSQKAQHDAAEKCAGRACSFFCGNQNGGYGGGCAAAAFPTGSCDGKESLKQRAVP